MSRLSDDAHTPVLFAHSKRKDWGVSVLAWELSGKRGYLFEDGVERTLASGFFELMNRVEKPSADQKATSLRLQRLVDGCASARRLSVDADGPTFYDQIMRLRKLYPAGLVDARWVDEVRGEGKTRPRSSRRRDALIREAQEQLNVTVLDALLASQRYAQLWEVVVRVLGRSDLVPKSQLQQPKAPRAEQQRELALATRELLFGQDPYEARFNRFLAALAVHSGRPARWEIATAVSALVHPAEHVCVHPTVLRQQFKIIGTVGTPPAVRPSGAGYARVLTATRVVAEKLTEQGEVPRDLLDVLDFAHVTLKATPKPQVSRVPSHI